MSETLLRDIAEFCRRARMAESTFGRLAVNDGKLEMEVNGESLAFDLSNIEKARLVPNI